MRDFEEDYEKRISKLMREFLENTEWVALPTYQTVFHRFFFQKANFYKTDMKNEFRIEPIS